MPNWKTWLPPGLSLAAGATGVLEGIPWQVALPWAATFLSVSLLGRVVAGIWNSVRTGEWVPKDEHQRALTRIDRLEAENLRLLQLVMQVSQTSEVAVSKIPPPPGSVDGD